MAIPSPKVWFPLALGALALASLALPFAAFFDPWAWLVWGRELTGFDLDTGDGPSWKPLPVMITAILSFAGDAAPDLWLAVARAGWLAAPALAALLAWRLLFPRRLATVLAERFAPVRVRRARALAAALAALGVLAFGDVFTAWSRQFAGGLSEPLLVALVLGAIERELAGRPGQALWLGFAAALLRPEAWPFLAIYGAHLWRSDHELRGAVAAVAAALPLLWFGLDLLGSGSPFTGAERAREDTGWPPFEALEAVARSAWLVPVGLWAGAVFAVITARRDGEREILVLALGAAGWIGVVALLAAGGFAGIPRFSAPAGAVVCVLGAVGIVRMLAAVEGMGAAGSRRSRALALVAVVLAVLGAQSAIRLAAVPGELSEAATYAEDLGDLERLVEDLDARALARCRDVSTSTFLSRTALAWWLERPLGGIVLRTSSAPRRGVAFVSRASPPGAGRAITRAGGERVGSNARWEAFVVGCPAYSDP